MTIATMTNDTNEWARAALREWLRRLISQAASELLREGMALTQAAERCRKWR